MDNSEKILGIDISKLTFDCCLITATGEHIGKFSNDKGGFDKLIKWIEEHQARTIHACMEATGNYWQALAAYLDKQGLKVSVENPAKIRHFSRAILIRTKTDKQDAQTIAKYCQTMKPEQWQPENPKTTQLKNILKFIDRIKKLSAAERAKLHESPEELKPFLIATIQHFKAQLATLDKQLKQLINSDSKLKAQFARLQTIPAIGKTSAAVLLSILTGSQQFQKPAQLAAYLGLNPQQRQSGTSVKGRVRISKIGSPQLRTSLYMPALVAYSKNLYPDFIARLKSKNKPAKVIIVALMRKLAVYAFAVHRNEKEFTR